MTTNRSHALPMIITLAATAPAAFAGAPGTTGACCFGDTICIENVTLETCDTADGTWYGAGSTCPEQQIQLVINATDGVLHGIRWAAECPLDPFLETCDPLLLLVNPTVTPPEGNSFVEFGSPAMPPIPPDFFGPGSEPFVGTVPFLGDPLGPTPFGDFGPADTLILRQDDPFDRCDLPSPLPQQVDIQIVELNLQSVQPIEVIIQGQPTLWDVHVDLSQIPSPPGQLVAVKEHCNGGIYDTILPVQPRFTFTEVGTPTNQVILDTGLEGINEWVLQSFDNPWVHDFDPLLGVQDPVCSAFHPGIEDLAPITDPLLCVVVVPGDLDGDGNVGFTDLNQLLAVWGPCPGCPEDIDGDGNVGFTDLNIVLGNWGPACP